MFKKQKIVFSNVHDSEMVFAYKPIPAFKVLPSWYKQMESRIPVEKKPESTVTIKTCIPVFDALTAGYILSTPCDVYVVIEEGNIVYKPAGENMISFHPRKQGHLHPSAMEYEFPKWLNSWAIKTPKGYSCLFIPPMHNPNPWFEVLEGIVDTDTYTSPVNFPFVLKNPTTEGLIPAGTPMVQVIPFKRDNWVMQTNNDFTHSRKVGKQLNSQFWDRYKTMFWTKKSYQ